MTFNITSTQNISYKGPNCLTVRAISFAGKSFSGLKDSQSDTFQKSTNNPVDCSNNEGQEQISNSLTEETHTIIEYKNKFSTLLKATPNPNLLKELKELQEAGIVKKADRAFQRISNLSRYLKEDMVGFITPSGEEWFEKACTYIIKGSAGRDIGQHRYVKYAEKVWSLIAMADPYWTSPDFIEYLESINTNPGVQATIDAINNIKTSKNVNKSLITFTGYDSLLKYIPKLREDGCAYTGKPLSLDREDLNCASIEHIFPYVIGSDDSSEDSNYLLTSIAANKERGCLSLVDYLLGWNQSEYPAQWLNKRNKRAKKKREFDKTLKLYGK